MVLAAEVALREALRERDRAPWIRAWQADRAVRKAEEELERVKALEPKQERRGFLGSAPPR